MHPRRSRLVRPREKRAQRQDVDVGVRPDRDVPLFLFRNNYTQPPTRIESCGYQFHSNFSYTCIIGACRSNIKLMFCPILRKLRTARAELLLRLGMGKVLEAGGISER